MTTKTTPPRLVIFDLDGTLSDSRATIIATFHAIAQQHSLHLPPEADIAALIGLPLEQMSRHIFPQGTDHAALVADYREHYVAISSTWDHLFPGAEALLDALRDRDIPLAIATSKSQRGAEHATARLGIAHRFAVIVGEHPDRRSKPHPDMIHLILDRLQVAPADAAMVGDTTFDLEMAQAAGVRGLGVAWGMHPPERLAPLAPVAKDWPALHALLGLG